MLTLTTGAKFAKNKNEFINTLFTGEGTPAGTYRKTKGGIKLFNLQGELFAFIVNNRHNEQFFVSASDTTNDNGRKQTRYMYSTDSITEKYLGIDKLGYMKTIDCAKNAINQLN